MGRSRIGRFLVTSQVLLSILAIRRFLTYVVDDKQEGRECQEPESDLLALVAGGSPSPTTEMIGFSNGNVASGLGYLTWAVVVIANVYVLATLAMGEGRVNFCEPFVHKGHSDSSRACLATSS